MYIVGTDEVTVAGGVAAPAGHRHAVGPDGRVLCRTSRPRFVWPALDWTPDASADLACTPCIQVHHSRQMFATVAAYPDGSAYAVVPAQPGIAGAAVVAAEPAADAVTEAVPGSDLSA